MVVSASAKKPEQQQTEANDAKLESSKEGASGGDKPDADKQPETNGIKLLVNWVGSVLSVGKACLHLLVFGSQRSKAHLVQLITNYAYGSNINAYACVLSRPRRLLSVADRHPSASPRLRSSCGRSFS